MRNIIIYAAVVLFTGLAQVPAVSAYSIGLTQVGTTNDWNVNFYGVNVTDVSKIVTGFDLDVTYSGTSATDVTFGSWLGDPNDFDAVITGVSLATTGLIDFYAVSLVDYADLQLLQSGITDGVMTLATLTFSSAVDVPSLSFINWYDGSGSLININDVKGPGFNNIIYDGPEPVPEPGTILLLGAGLAALFHFRRRLGLVRVRAPQVRS